MHGLEEMSQPRTKESQAKPKPVLVQSSAPCGVAETFDPCMLLGFSTCYGWKHAGTKVLRYSAIIPGAGLAAGSMLRWRAVVKDGNG